MSFVSSQPHPPMGGQKVMMKAPPGMVAANGKKVMMMPHGAMPPAGAMMVGGGKKMMAAPPPGSQMMLGKSMMSTASSMPAGSTSMRFTSPPGGGVKKMIAMPPQGAAVKMVKSMAPSAGGPSPGQSMMSHAGSGGTGVGAARPGPAASAPAFTVVNGKKMMLPPGAKIMSPPGPMGQKLPMGSNSNSSGVFNGAPGGGGSASLPNAGARPTATTPAAPGHGGAGVVPLSAMETRTGASPSGKPTAEPDKKKRHSLFSFLHIGSSSDEDEGAAAALSPARPQPMSATAATATAPSAMQGKKIMTDAPAGALSSAMPPGTGQPQPMMKKMMMPASGLPPAGAVATGKQPVSILQKKMPGAPAQGGAQGSSPPAASGVKFISMPSGNQNGYGGNMSLASSMVNMARTSGSAGSTAQSMPAGAASAAANTSASTAQSQSPEPDAVSDELMHSTTTLERMAAAAAAAASEAPSDGGTKPQPAATGMASSIQSTAPTATPAPAGGAAAGRSASPNSGGLRVASSTRLGGEASTSLESAGVAHAAAAGGGSGGASTSATRKAPIKRLNGRFSAFTVTDSDEDSSAQEEEPQPAPGADGATTSVSRDQVSSSSRSLTPAERASGGSPAADKNSTDEDEGAGSPAPSEDAVSVNSAAPRADGEAALGKSLSTKLSLPSLAGSTQPPHTRQVSRDVSKGAHVNLASQSKSKVTSRVKPAPRPTATAASSTRAKAPPTPPSPAKKKKTTTPTPLRNRSSPVSAPARASSAAEKKKKQQPTTATRTTARQASVSTLGGDDDDDDDKGVAETDSTRSTIMVNKDDEEDDNTHVAHSESGKDGGTDADQNTDNANDHVRQDGARREKVKAQKVSTSQRERRHQPDNSVNSDETDGSAADEATPALSGRDLYRLVALLKKEESRDASGGGVRSSSRTRSRTRGRLGRRGSGEAEREPDAWDRLGRGGGEEARFREPYAVHLHSTREIIGSPGIPWRYTDKHAGSEPFPPAPSVARPLGVINIGGGRYAALRTRGESSPYSLARTAGGGGGASMSMTSSPQRHSTPLSSRPARLRSQSANDADMYGHGRSSTPPGRDRYTSAIMDDLSHSAIRAAQVHALGLPGPRRGTVGSLSPGSAMLEEVHPYCSSPPRPLLSSIPVSRGDVHVRAGGGLRTSDEEPRLQPSAGHALPTSSTRESSPGKTRQEPTFFDVNRQMYFGTSLSTPTSPLRASSGGGGGGGGMLQRRERLLVSPVRDEPASRTGPNVVSHGLRDSPLLFRPPTAASSTSPSSTRGRKGRGRSLSASQVPKPKPQPPSLIPNSVAAARSASQPTRTQSPRQGKPTQARLTPEAIERLAAPPARSASAPRTYREYVARGQHSRGRGTRGVGSSQATAASRCGHWVDEVLSAMSESQQDAGGAESTRPVVQIPRVDLRSEFKPVILNDADDEDTRRRKLSLALASTTADADPSSTLIIGSRARPHVPGLSFKHMTGIRSPQRSGRSRIATTTTTAAGAGDGDTSVSASHEKSAVVVVANMSPAEGMPFDKYSTVTVKDPQRPSAWALTPERDAEFGGVLPGQAAVRRVVRRRDGTATDGEDAAEEGMYVTVEEVHLDEFKRPYVVIKRVPCGAAAERQKEVSKRLSIPRRRFVRAEDNEGPAKA